MPLSHDHIRTTVDAYLARHPRERKHLGRLLDALGRPADITDRSTFTGHVTCGAVVVDPLGRVLHVLHLASGNFHAPGGHPEPADEFLAGTALRELHEETGIPPHAVAAWPGYETVPVDIKVHRVNARPAKREPRHQHFDFRFLFRLRTATAVPVVLQEDEVGGIEWRTADTVTSRSLRKKLLTLTLTPGTGTEPETANASADLVRRHATGHPAVAVPHGTVLNVIGVHLYLERPDGTVLLGLRHPDSAFAPSTWHVLAGHCEQESAVTCLIREAHEEAGLHIAPGDVELVHVVHHIDKPGDRPRMGLFFRARAWNGEPELREPDKCTQWKFWDPGALPADLVPYTRTAIDGIRAGRPYSEAGWA
jgi:8-oxo-dGTP pyrophosphatase MutT (NUDIX family)